MNKWIAVVSVLLSVACHRNAVVLHNDEVVEATSRFSDAHAMTFDHHGEKLTIDGPMRPELELKTSRRCSLKDDFANRCDRRLRVPLAHVGTMGEQLTLKVKTSMFLNTTRTVTLSPDEIERAKLHYNPRVDASWRPRWAFGAMFFGPIGFVGPQMHWFMFDQFVVDIGAMGAPHIGVFYGGVRFRPVRFGNVLPFVGGVSNAILGANPDPDSTADTPPSGRVGPRLGVDIELSGRRLLLGLEADLFYNLSGDGFIFGDEGNWQPFGGLYLAYQI